MPSPFHQPNKEARERLETLSRRLAEQDLTRTTPTGWTVASLFAHLTFWERRVFVLLQRWQANGYDDSPMDADMTNDALKPMWLALDPHQAIELCLSSAQATDALIETVSPELLAQIETGPTFMRLNRSLHRNGHLNEIEAALAA